MMQSTLRKCLSAAKNVVLKIYQERILIVLIAIFSIVSANHNGQVLEECQRSDTTFFVLGYVTSIEPDLSCMQKKHDENLAILEKQHAAGIMKMTAEHSLGSDTVSEVAIIVYTAMKNESFREALRRALTEYQEVTREEHGE